MIAPSPTPARCALAGPELAMPEYSKLPLLPYSALTAPLPPGLRVFDREGELFVGPEHHVGLLPITCTACKEPHLLLVLPKGVDPSDAEKVRLGLLHFVELLAITNGGTVTEEPAWRPDAGLGASFLLLLAEHYAAMLQELCRVDFRRFYRHESDPLTGRVRGRLLVAPHLANCLRGAAHRVPCQWDEFTADNLDNRILKQAHLALVGAALRLGSPEAARWIQGQFRGIGGYFDEISDLPVSAEDLRRTRLDRLSSHYRRSLRWARLILRGTRRVRASREAPQLLIDANDAFEKLARLIVRRAIPSNMILVDPKRNLDETLLKGGPGAEPDIQITSGSRTVAIGDAKYKKVLELADTENAATDSFDAVARLRLKADDLYQLYAYQRITQAPVGFLVVPYWSWGPDARAAELLPVGPFNRSPIDSPEPHTLNHAIAVLGLNMAKRPALIVQEAVGQFRIWLTANLGRYQR